jgi:hypothetical protein
VLGVRVFSSADKIDCVVCADLRATSSGPGDVPNAATSRLSPLGSPGPSEI